YRHDLACPRHERSFGYSARSKLVEPVSFLSDYCYMCFFLEMDMARSNLGSMSVEALLKLRDDVGKVLSQRATQLEEQLSRLGGEVGSGRRGRGSAMKGRKVPVKYRDKES